MGKIWQVLIFLSLGMALSGPMANAAVDVGGYVVKCRKSDKNSFEGYYALDYLAQYNSTIPILDFKNLDDSLQHFEDFIKIKVPELYYDFLLFQQSLFNSDPTTSVYIWEEAPFGLVDVKDENLVTLLPENCRNGDISQITPVTVMQSPETNGTKKWVVKYQPSILRELQATRPVQASFLIVRAWLTRNSTNIDRNRRLNYWFHSLKTDEWSRRYWNEAFLGLGFVLPEVASPEFVTGYCNGSSEDEGQLVSSILSARHRLIGSFVHTYAFEYERYNDCDPSAVGNCSWLMFQEHTPQLRHDFFNPAVSMIYEDDALWVVSDDGNPATPDETRHIRCGIDAANKKFLPCEALTAKDGSVIALPRPMKVFAGKNCIKLMSGEVKRTQKTTYVSALSLLLDL